MIHVLLFATATSAVPHGGISFPRHGRKRGLSAQFPLPPPQRVARKSATEYPPAKRKLASVGISCTMHHARQVTKEDYAAYDYLLVAERYNIPNLMRQIKEDPDHKVYRLLDFSSRPRDIADPWYTGDFDITYHDITEGLEGFLAYLKKRKQAIRKDRTTKRSISFPLFPHQTE